jgi:hypothetical protein
MELFIGNDINSPKANKVIDKMKKLKAIDDQTIIEFVCGKVLLGSMPQCIIGTDKELIYYELQGILPKISNYLYRTITGISFNKTIKTNIILSIGNAQTETLISYCSMDEAKKIVDFVLDKIK